MQRRITPYHRLGNTPNVQDTRDQAILDWLNTSSPATVVAALRAGQVTLADLVRISGYTEAEARQILNYYDNASNTPVSSPAPAPAANSPAANSPAPAPISAPTPAPAPASSATRDQLILKWMNSASKANVIDALNSGQTTIEELARIAGWTVDYAKSYLNWPTPGNTAPVTGTQTGTNSQVNTSLPANTYTGEVVGGQSNTLLFVGIGIAAYFLFIKGK